MGFPILYGDGSRPAVLQTAGIASPKAVMVMYTAKQQATEAVQRIRLAFPAVPIYARAQDLLHLLDLKKVGATDAILENAETSLQLGSKLLKGLGVMSDDVSFLSQLVRDSMELQAQEALTKADDRDSNVLQPLQVRVADLIGTQSATSSIAINTQFPSPDQLNKIDILALDLDNNQTPEIQAERDLSLQDSSTEQSDDADGGKGVLYCELDAEENVLSKEKDVKGQKNVINNSIPCMNTSEGP